MDRKAPKCSFCGKDAISYFDYHYSNSATFGTKRYYVCSDCQDPYLMGKLVKEPLRSIPEEDYEYPNSD